MNPRTLVAESFGPPGFSRSPIHGASVPRRSPLLIAFSAQALRDDNSTLQQRNQLSAGKVRPACLPCRTIRSSWHRERVGNDAELNEAAQRRPGWRVEILLPA